MINVGQYVKVYADDRVTGMLVELCRGFIEFLGDKQVKISTGKGTELFRLKNVCLEAAGDLNNHDYGTANMPKMTQIRNKATGNGCTRNKGGKARFKQNSVWESRPGRW